MNRFIRAHAQPGPVRPGQLHVTIIGAGATGTELAAELHRTTRQVVAMVWTASTPERDLKITLVEAAERILPAVPPRVAEGASDSWKGLASRYAPEPAWWKSGRTGSASPMVSFIPSELVVWAAGVKGPDLLKDHRRPRGEPEQSTRRDADAADDTGSRTSSPLEIARFCSAPAKQGLFPHELKPRANSRPTS